MSAPRPAPRPAPKHRAAPRTTSRTALRTAVVMTTLGGVGLATAAAGGTWSATPDDEAVAQTAIGAAPVAQALDEETTDRLKAAAVLEAERDDVVSRSDRRGVADPVKAASLAMDGDNLMDRSEDRSDEDPRTLARALMSEVGFAASQFSCLDQLWTRESGWRVDADNPYSSAYGIPQALPGSKMSSAGADWATNPVTQIRWGLGYIAGRYGTPCGAWAHSESVGWY